MNEVKCKLSCCRTGEYFSTRILQKYQKRLLATWWRDAGLFVSVPFKGCPASITKHNDFLIAVHYSDHYA